MSFHISFFARDVASAQEKLRQAHAPSAVKTLIELALAGIGRHPVPVAPPMQAPYSSQDAAKALFDKVRGYSPAPVQAPRAPQLCGVRVEAIGHIDENGHQSNIASFKIEPLFD